MSLENPANPTIPPIAIDEIALAKAAFAAEKEESAHQERTAAQVKATIEEPPKFNKLTNGDLLLLAQLAGNPETLAALNNCLNFANLPDGQAAKLVSREDQPKLEAGNNTYIIQPDTAGNLYALIDTESGKQPVYIIAESTQWNKLTSGLEREVIADPGYLSQFHKKPKSPHTQSQLPESLQGILQRIIEAMEHISKINRTDAFAIQIIKPYLIACLLKVDHTNNAVEYCITPKADSLKLEIFVANRKTHTRKPLDEFIIH